MKAVFIAFFLSLFLVSCDTIKFPTTLPGTTGVVTEGEAGQGIKEALAQGVTNAV
jgi:hypothetical protein